MSNDKMKVWEFANKTPPSATKHGKVGGQIITSINPTYMAKKATELFGPAGIGWGYEVDEERFDNGAPIFSESGEVLCYAQNHTVKIKFWFKDPSTDQRGEISHYGHTKYMYKSKNGITVDEEAPKKSLTDAIKKCLSMLGFSADVFLGQFDDGVYVEERQREEQIEKAEDKIEEKRKQQEDRDKWLSDVIRLIGESKNKNLLRGLYTESVRKAKIRNDEQAILKIEKAKDAKLKELESNE